MNKSKHTLMVLLFSVFFFLSASSVMAAWELVSQYDMEGSYTAAPPGSGDALADAGPAGNPLYTVNIGGAYPESEPCQMSPGSNGSGDAFFFDASQGDTLHASLSINMMAGFNVSFDFKESGVQTNPYPRFFRVEKNGSISPGGFKVQGLAGGGVITDIEFWMYPGGVKCSVAGNWNDGQWHHVEAEYDPAGAVMTLTVDDQTATASFTSTEGFVTDKIKLGFPYDDDSTGLERGFDGGIDNLQISQRSISYQPYTTYSMDGTYDRNAGTGTALSDSGPVSDNPLSQYSGGDLTNSPSQESAGFSGEAFSFDGLEPQLFTAAFSMDMASGFIGKVKFKTDIVPDPVQAYPYMLRMDGGSTLVLQGMYRTDPNRFDNISMNFAGQVTLSMANPSGTGWNDNAWHEITFGYEPHSGGGWTFVKIDDDVDLHSYRSSVGSVTNNTAMTIGATTSLNNRYGYSGIIDDVEFHYAVLATQVITPGLNEILYRDDDYFVTWDADVHLGGADVTLEFSPDNGGAWTVMDTVANTGSYLWTVPQITPSGQCLIRVRNSNDDKIIYATSEPFTIIEQCPLDADITGDCRVDLYDLVELGKEWLK